MALNKVDRNEQLRNEFCAIAACNVAHFSYKILIDCNFMVCTRLFTVTVKFRAWIMRGDFKINKTLKKIQHKVRNKIFKLVLSLKILNNYSNIISMGKYINSYFY